MDFSDACYEVRFVNGQGNGLFASRDIVPGELILKEFPFVWNAFKNVNHSQSSFCYACGCSLETKDTRISCEECQVNFCSSRCQSAADVLGHRFICPSYRNRGLVDSFTETDRSGHFVLALQCYAQIAAEYVAVVSTLPTTGAAANYCAIVKQAAHTILSGYHSDDFCRSKHAIRTGKLDILSENMFESMIAPAYFSTSGLEDAQTQIFNAFAALPLSLWTVAQANIATESSEQQPSVREAFLHTGEDGIFTPMFFRKLVGTFSVNNHHVHLKQEHDTAATDAALCDSPTTLFTAVDTAHGVLAQQLQLLGTALYLTVSKMNHSCECNTTNSHSRQDVQLAVYATAHITAGQELTTTYLHRRSSQAKPQSRRSRHKALLQYLFACTCAKCEQELQQLREDRRLHRAAAGKPPLEDDESDSEDSDNEESSDEEEEGSEQYGNSSSACY